MKELELTSEQKHEISVELNASDFYETVPFLNHVLKVLGYSDYMEDDDEREELRWTKRKEPLIKNEKVRKAVRAWAKANDILDEIEAHSLTAGTRFSIGHYGIEFMGYFIYGLESNKTYTIAELCGEEEE